MLTPGLVPDLCTLGMSLIITPPAHSQKYFQVVKLFSCMTSTEIDDLCGLLQYTYVEEINLIVAYTTND